MNLFKTRLLTLIRTKELIFWALIFPIVLSVFYSLAFSNINKAEFIQTIDIAIIDLDEDLFDTLKELKINEDMQLFNLKETSLEEAEELLNNNLIAGFISHNNEKIKLTINKSTIETEIIKNTLNTIVQTKSVYIDLIINHGKDNLDINESFKKEVNYIDEVATNRNKTNAMLIAYFSLLGMAIINASFWGTNNIINLQANMSPKGIRIAVSPTNRLKVLIIHTLSAFVVHMLIITVILFHYIVILGLPIKDKLGLTYLISVLGTLVGISFGSFIAIALKKAKEGTKVLITTLVGILGGFLSGMMVIEVKYFIQTKIPFLNYINPIGLITDSLHTLNLFGVGPRLYLNLAVLGLMAIMLIIGTYIFYRRDSYESI